MRSPGSSGLTDMENLLTVDDLAQRWQCSPLSARRRMKEIGETIIGHKPFVRESALERYEADRTRSTYYNRPQYERRKTHDAKRA